MNKRFLFIFLLISIFSFGQSYEEKIAEKSCHCISKDTKTDDLNALIKKCIILAHVTHVLKYFIRFSRHQFQAFFIIFTQF